MVGKKYAVVVQNIPGTEDFVENMLSYFVAEDYDGIILMRNSNTGHEFAHETIGLSRAMMISRLERLATEVTEEDIVFLATVAPLEKKENNFAMKVQDKYIIGRELEKGLKALAANTVGYFTATLPAAEVAHAVSWVEHETLGYRIVGISSLPKRLVALPKPYQPANLKPPYIQQRKQGRHFPTVFDYTFFLREGKKTVEERFKDANNYQRIVHPALGARMFTRNSTHAFLYV